MTCPHCRATEAKFSRAVAEGDLRRYHRHGPNATTRMILADLAAVDAVAATVLDVGAGIGVLTHELLARGASRATIVDASPAYLAAAQSEAQARGTAGRVTFVQGDASDVAAAIPPCDIVALDRVVCCYPEYQRLLEACASRCRRALSLSFPRDRWYVRLVIAAENLLRRLRKDRFRTFVHPESALHQALASAGLRRVRSATTIAWQVEMYVRPTP